MNEINVKELKKNLNALSEKLEKNKINGKLLKGKNKRVELLTHLDDIAGLAKLADSFRKQVEAFSIQKEQRKSEKLIKRKTDTAKKK